MRFRQEFSLPEGIPRLWSFFEQPERVAACIPGVESVERLDEDTLTVRATQKLGPLSATFESRVQITERVEGQRITFTSTGKAVRGAAGSFRASNSVSLSPAGSGTLVVVEGEAALAGVLGSVGQKVVAKQADRVTAEFAENLERALAGEAAPAAGTAGAAATTAPLRPQAGARPLAAAGQADVPRDPWVKVAVVLSGTATLLGLINLLT